MHLLTKLNFIAALLAIMVPMAVNTICPASVEQAAPPEYVAHWRDVMANKEAEAKKAAKRYAKQSKYRKSRYVMKSSS
jgi:hypothetical protein